MTAAVAVDFPSISVSEEVVPLAATPASIVAVPEPVVMSMTKEVTMIRPPVGFCHERAPPAPVAAVMVTRAVRTTGAPFVALASSSSMSPAVNFPLVAKFGMRSS